MSDVTQRGHLETIEGYASRLLGVVAALERENAGLIAERQRDALDGQAALDEANNQIVQLKAKVAAAERVLQFYADPETYHACTFLFDPPTGGFDEDMDTEHGHPNYDRPMPGKMARQALAALDATGEGAGQ